MRVVLVGADSEENLGLGMVAASLQAAGHAVRVVPLLGRGQVDPVADRVLAAAPDLVGLGVQFQHLALDLHRLALELRRRGFRGHLTAGGQHATLSWDRLLADNPAVDSVVLHEGEATAVELCAALERGAPLDGVAGLGLRGAAGPRRTATRALAANLDALPFPHRYRPHDRHLGLPFIPVSGSRGCWGSCSFCSIAAYYRQAHAAGAGRRFRLRSTASLAEELAALHHAAGAGASLFCFHDDTLLLPQPAATVARLGALRDALAARGVNRYGLLGKGRPETITPELAGELRRLGVVRMFVGIENAAQPGQDHLHRRTRTAELRRALAALEGAGIMAAYNLLLFEPDATLADVRENAAFLRAFPATPGNFCRAEPYHGTALHAELARRGALLGSHVGWDYRLADDRVEVLFRLVLAAFRDRNYSPLGVANRQLGLAYSAAIARAFHGPSTAVELAAARASALVARISLDSADLLDHAVDEVERLDLGDAPRVARAAVELALRVAAQDRRWHHDIDRAIAEIAAAVAGQSAAPRTVTARARRAELPARLAVAGSLLVAAACGGDVDDSRGPGGGAAGADVADGDGGDETGGSPSGGGTGGMPGDGGAPPVVGGSSGSGGFLGDGGWPTGGGHGDTGGVPPIGGGGTGGMSWDGGAPPVVGGSSGSGGFLGDGGVPTGGYLGDGGWTAAGGAPPTVGGDAGSGGLMDDGGVPTGGYDGAGAGGVGASDPGPEPVVGGSSGTGGVQGDGGWPAVGGGGTSAHSREASANDADGSCDSAEPLGSELVNHWRDVTPVHLTRDPSLPLYDPPAVTLEAWRRSDGVHVLVRGATADLELTFAGPGRREVAGAELVWFPTLPGDRLTVVARGPGGVSSTTLTASSVPRAGG